MLRPVTDFFAPRVHKLDNAILAVTRGKYTAVEILGWNVIQLTTIGAKTHQIRTIPLVGIFDEEKIVLIASSFGRKYNPGWYYNLKANPDTTVQIGSEKRRVHARVATDEERERLWPKAVKAYGGYADYQKRTDRKIPLVVLERR